MTPLPLLALLLLQGSAPGAGTGSPLPLASRVVCLDPGHPSETSLGTRGPGGLTEIRMNWRLALELRLELQHRGARVVLTKQSEDEHVTNRRRAEIANEAGADLLLRIHGDAVPGARGFALYYPAAPGERDGARGPSQAVIDGSARAATAFHRSLAADLPPLLADRGLGTDAQTYVGKQQGALTGSIFSRVPVLTVEVCVLTNPDDERVVADPATRARVVTLLAEATAAALAALPLPSGLSPRDGSP